MIKVIIATVIAAIALVDFAVIAGAKKLGELEDERIREKHEKDSD